MATAIIDLTENQLQPTTIQPPDLSRLPAVDFDQMLQLEVRDESSCALARDYGRAAKDYQSQVDLLLKEPTEAANKLHKFFTGLRGALTAKAKAVEAHAKDQIGTHLRREEEKRLTLQAELQRQAEERARLEADRIQREREESIMPWDLEEDAPAPEPVVINVTPVVIAPLAAPLGVKAAKKPWDFEVYDLPKFMAAALADPTLLEYVDKESFLNKKMMKAKAQQLGPELEKRFPGVRAIRGTSIRY